MKHSLLTFTFLVIFLFDNSPSMLGCTNFIVTKGASGDGSVMITYAADSHTRYGAIAFFPAASHQSGDRCEIFHYESGKYLGSIPEVPRTYSVVQFMNEHQVSIGETTFGGLDSLAHQPDAILDYGSLMRIGLQRAKSARELIRVITSLVEEFGYASAGESFSISDAKEAWIMEMIGKGRYEKGAVWVARLVPDGFVCGHANQARITTFPQVKNNHWDDPLQTVYHSPDVVTFAIHHGFYKGDPEHFSFSDVYNPLGFGGARYCDARVWTFFRKVNKDIRDNDRYTQYALGKFLYEERYTDGTPNPNRFPSNRLPLWIKPDQGVSLQEVMAAMRDHYENTPLEMRYDLGAGPYQSPYRWRPMEFNVNGITYLNERAVATQQTGYSFVAQSRGWLPAPAGGIFWFGVDDADGCVYAPMYCGITAIPSEYRTGNGSMIRWSDSSAFWTFNQVNNFAYSRYNVIHPEIEAYQTKMEQNIFHAVGITDQAFLRAYAEDPRKGAELLTRFSAATGKQIVADWKAFYHYLFMKYMDGNTKQSEGFRLLENGFGKEVPKKPSHPGYGAEWESRMVDGTGDRLRVPENK